ncbi:MAG: hypothetical protein KDE33_09810 [Bacteroidetes bacterium]|nr:hypothetical protein [Bacteroidota bacterium]
MKKTHLIISMFFLGVSGYSQNDTIYFSKEQFDSKIESIQNEFQKNLDSKFSYSISKSNAVESRLLDSIKTQNARIKELERLLEDNKSELSKTSSELVSTKENLSSVKDDTANKISNLDESISSKTLLSFILIVLSAGLAIILFVMLRRRLTNDTSKLDGQITSTRSALEAEHMKLDQKLIEMLDTQLHIQKEERSSAPPKEEEIDHSLALKVADEIVRMQKNISNMPEDTKGLKQLSKALQRIQDTFKVNGYEMIEMLGTPYNEGMKVVAKFVPDENLEKGQQIITRIIKPQVNFNGVMIQSAQIEVSIGE